MLGLIYGKMREQGIKKRKTLPAFTVSKVFLFRYIVFLIFVFVLVIFSVL